MAGRTGRTTTHAGRHPALAQVVAEGVIAPADDDPLAFGRGRVLDGAQALMDRSTA